MEEKIKLRDKLVDVALQWQASFGIAPSITSSISEYDAAMLGWYVRERIFRLHER